MSQDVFCGFPLPVLLAFLALVLLLVLMAPMLARELAALRMPPPVRGPAAGWDGGRDGAAHMHFDDAVQTFAASQVLPASRQR